METKENNNYNCSDYQELFWKAYKEKDIDNIVRALENGAIIINPERKRLLLSIDSDYIQLGGFEIPISHPLIDKLKSLLGIIEEDEDEDTDYYSYLDEQCFKYELDKSNPDFYSNNRKRFPFSNCNDD